MIVSPSARDICWEDTQEHAVKSVVIAGCLVDIDERIADSIALLNSHRIYTMMCCQGGLPPKLEYAYVVFFEQAWKKLMATPFARWISENCELNAPKASGWYCILFEAEKVDAFNDQVKKWFGRID